MIAESRQINENHYKLFASLLLGECYLKQKQFRELEELLHDIEENETANNLFIQGSISRLRGLANIVNNEFSLAINQLKHTLSVFTMAGDYYQAALANLELGQAQISVEPESADKYISAALDAFRHLEIPEQVKTAENLITSIKSKKTSKTISKSLNQHLLMLRLAESISSRELLFRELITILREETKAKKILIAEPQKGDKLSSSIIDGFSPSEGVELLNKMHQAQIRNNYERFIKDKKLAVFNLRAPNSVPAALIIYPANIISLADGSSIQPLLRIVELGMEICSFRKITRILQILILPIQVP